MSEEKSGGWAHFAGGSLGSARWVTRLFLLFLASLGGAVAFILFHDGKGWAVLVGLAAVALVWVLEHLEVRYIPGPGCEWNPLKGHIVPVVVISLAAFALCLPTLNSYFSSFDFAYIHLFGASSLSQFLSLFHTDLSQGVFGMNVQELRPLYGLSYKLSYSLWGLRPRGYHLSCGLLNVLNSLMVFLIAKRMLPGNSWRAGFAGLLFATLPVHLWVVSSPSICLTEGPPTLFYLVAFLCFVCYRGTGLKRYLLLSATAFTLCLLSKETGITLPVMLISYDVYRKVLEGNANSVGANRNRRKQWQGLALSHAPFLTLLLAYLGWRKIIFSSFLKENTWEATWGYHKRASGLMDLVYHVAYFGHHVGDLQVLNLRELLLPFPTALLGLVLGLYLFWALSLWKRRSEYRGSLEVVVYFGVVWYLISNLPLLGIYLSSSHLYLPSAGFCIAIASMAAPACTELRNHAKYLPQVGAGFLVCLCACQVWKGDTEEARKAQLRARVMGQWAAALEDVPRQTLVILPASSGMRTPDAFEETLPYALQEPFRAADLYSRARIIEGPDAYCGGLAHWWKKTKVVLAAELAGSPEEAIEVDLLAWDDRTNSSQRKKRVLPKKLLQACVTQSLGKPMEEVGPLGWTESRKLVEALAKLTLEGGDSLAQE